MYELFYRFNTKPFQLTPDPRYFFSGACHKKALAYLQYGVYRGEGFTVITGAPGTGKTTLMQTLVENLSARGMIIVELVTTQLEGDDVLRAFASHLNLSYEGLTKAALLQRIEDFLTDHARNNDHVLLIVDEAHHLSPRALDELRMLTNFQLRERALMQCILLGQDPLRETLAMPDMEQLRQRIIAACHLDPLNGGETKAYIEHRLGIAGWDNDPRITNEAYALIHYYTGGIVRRINVLCDRLLLSSSLEERHEIDGQIVNAVHNELAEECGEEDEDTAHHPPPSSHGPLGFRLNKSSAAPEITALKASYPPESSDHTVTKARIFDYESPSASSSGGAALAIQADHYPEPEGALILEGKFTATGLDVEQRAAEPTKTPTFPETADGEQGNVAHVEATKRGAPRHHSPSRRAKHRWSSFRSLPMIMAAALLLTGTLMVRNPVPLEAALEGTNIIEPAARPEDKRIAVDAPSEAIAVDETSAPPENAANDATVVKNGLDEPSAPDARPADTHDHSTVEADDTPNPHMGVSLAAVSAVSSTTAARSSPKAPVPQSAPSVAAAPDRVTAVETPRPAIAPPPAPTAPTTTTPNSLASNTELSLRPGLETSSPPRKEISSASNKSERPVIELRVAAEPNEPPKVITTTSEQGPAVDPVTPTAVAALKQITAPAQQNPATTDVPQSFPREALDALLRRFTTAYETGNVTELMNLLGATIRTNDSDNRKGVEKDYRKLFGVTDERRIAFTDVYWSIEDDQARGLGQFNATVRQKGRFKSDNYSGSIRMQVKKDPPGIVITELFYDYN